MKKVKEPSPTLFPLPVVLVTVGDKNDPEIITVSWTGVLSSNPPVLGVSIRPKRDTFEEINNTGEFVINIPTAEQTKEVDLCGMTSSEKQDKWGLTGFSIEDSEKVKTPGIKQCPVNIECKANDKKELGSHHLFIGEVLSVHVDENYINSSGEIDFNKIKPIAFTGASYWGLGEKIASEGFSKEAGYH